LATISRSSLLNGKTFATALAEIGPF
jgi:hypothetical protein